jgi:hypothetical protein
MDMAFSPSQKMPLMRGLGFALEKSMGGEN